jgi:hypothetical protein
LGTLWVLSASLSSLSSQTIAQNVCANRTTYTGTAANGIVIGIPTQHATSRFQCTPCLSFPNLSKTPPTLPPSKNFPGNKHSNCTFPFSTSSTFLFVAGGRVFRPHSSKGIRRKSAFPYSVTFFCQPFSAFSQFVQSADDLVMMRSAIGGFVAPGASWGETRSQ